MVENLNDDLTDTPVSRRTVLIERFRKNWFLILGGIVGLMIWSVLITMAFTGPTTVRLSERDFYCSKPTATNRFNFGRVETCDQYSRNPGTSRWDR